MPARVLLVWWGVRRRDPARRQALHVLYRRAGQRGNQGRTRMHLSPLAESAPNKALEPTPNSLRSCVAPALGRGSALALGCSLPWKGVVKFGA